MFRQNSSVTDRWTDSSQHHSPRFRPMAPECSVRIVSVGMPLPTVGVVTLNRQGTADILSCESRRRSTHNIAVDIR